MRFLGFLLFFLPLIVGQIPQWLRSQTFSNGRICGGSVYKVNYFLSDRCAIELNVRASCPSKNVTSYTSPTCLGDGKSVNGECKVDSNGRGDYYETGSLLCGAIEDVKIDPKANDTVIESYSSPSCDSTGAYPFLIQVIDQSQQSCRNSSISPNATCLSFGNYYRKYYCGSSFVFKTRAVTTSSNAVIPTKTQDPYGGGGPGGSGVQLKLLVLSSLSTFQSDAFTKSVANLLKVDSSMVGVSNAAAETGINASKYIGVYFQLNDGDNIGSAYQLVLALNSELSSNSRAISGFEVKGVATFPDGSSLGLSGNLVVGFLLIVVSLVISM